MNAYFLTAKQITTIVDIAINNRYGDRYIGYRNSPEELANQIVKELKSEPIELNDVSIGEIYQPCMYYPLDHIIGFSQKDNVLHGVFIKE